MLSVPVKEVWDDERNNAKLLATGHPAAWSADP